MRNPTVLRPVRGFSLIEVLIAVVVLSVGLLALASLQMNLIRSSADAKAQSVAMALAKERLEQLLSFQATGGADSTCISPAAGTSNTCYRAITTVSDTPTVGGVAYTRTATVTRYVYDKSSGAAGFKSVGNAALDSTLLTSPVTYLVGKEFKKIVMTVTWTDAAGSSANVVTVEDAIGAINPADSAAVSKSSRGATPRKAQAIITNPASVAGVIPIAIGNGTDTAATNPRPIIVSQGNSSTAVETRFDIYSYVPVDSNSAQVQQRIETAVVGCKCTSTGTAHSANRPTYWDGYQYTIPTTAANIPVSAPVTGNSVTQSSQCTICCRDHFDPSGVAGEKFDPRRTTHNHYLATDLATIVTAGTYNESCRLIRVNGIFRVASEPYNDHYGLLGTVGLMSSTATTTVANAVPGTGSGSVSSLYQAYVLNYLKARFVDITAYNTPLDPTTVTGYSAIQVPTTASINGSTTPQYLHSRGLVIDNLSTETIAALTQVKADCIVTSCTAAELQTAILKLLPFTSINTTELAKWTTTNSAKIGVSLLQDFAESINQSLPVSGRATYNSGASADTVTANTTIQGGSAGLALSPDIFPATAYSGSFYSKTDAQPFVIGSGGVVGSNPGGETFSLVLTGSDFLANVLVGNPAQVYFESPTYKSCTPNASTMTPYTCITDTNFALGGSTPIKIGNYNRSGSKTVQNSCTRPNPNSNADDTTAMPFAITFDVASATVDGTAVTLGTVTNNNIPGISGEYTEMTANPVNVNSTVTVNFSAKTYLCPSNWDSFLDSSGDDGTMSPDNGNSSVLCTGNGGNKAPAWNTTSYKACWSGFAP